MDAEVTTIGKRIGFVEDKPADTGKLTDSCRKTALDRRLAEAASYKCGAGECKFECRKGTGKPNIPSIRCTNKGRWRLPEGLGKLRHHQSIYCGDTPSHVVGGRALTGPCGEFNLYNKKTVKMPECDRNKKKCSFRKMGRKNGFKINLPGTLILYFFVGVWE